jgi:hypothetical protein
VGVLRLQTVVLQKGEKERLDFEQTFGVCLQEVLHVRGVQERVRGKQQHLEGWLEGKWHL